MTVIETLIDDLTARATSPYTIQEYDRKLYQRAADAISAPHAQGDVAGLKRRLLDFHKLTMNADRILVLQGSKLLEAQELALDAAIEIDALSLPHSDGAVAEPVAWTKRDGNTVASAVPTTAVLTVFDWYYTADGKECYARTPERAAQLRADGAALTPVYTIEKGFAASPINPVPAGVGVKELEWTQLSDGKWQAPSVVGLYSVYCGQWWRDKPDIWVDGTVYPDNPPAQAAAQADYETRIRSALRQAPDAEQGAGE